MEKNADAELAQKLIETGLLRPDEIDTFKANAEHALTEEKNALLGQLFLVDMEVQEMQVIDLATDEEKHHLLFPDVPFQESEWDKRGSHLLLVNEADGTFLAYEPWDLAAPYGLVSSKQGNYLYQDDILNADFIPFTSHQTYCAVFRGTPETGPYDLTVSPDHKYLALSDRGRGTIRIISAETYNILHSKQITPQGNLSALNLAFNPDKNCLYITENKSARLLEMDLDSGDMLSHKPGFGLLSNLVLAPDQQHLFLLTIKPQQELLYISLTDWKIQKRIKLKGELFQLNNSDPMDLLCLSPDGQLLLLMTYQNSPIPFTPIISVIDTHEQKTIRRYALKDGAKPAHILFGRPNPYKQKLNQSLKTQLLQAGRLSESDFQELNQTMVSGDLQKAPAHPSQIPSELDAQDGLIDAPHLSHFHSPPETERFSRTEKVHCIVNLLVERFYEKSKINLADKPRVMGYLEAEAEEICSKLENQSNVQVAIERIYGDKSLRFLLRRRDIQLKLELNDYLKNIVSFMPPQNCPHCEKNLQGQWECSHCHYELHSPIHTFKQKNASADTTAYLPIGHFLVPDPLALKVLELNQELEIISSFAVEDLDFPEDVYKLSETQFLLLDSQTQHIVELDESGQKVWQQKPDFLSAPSYMNYYFTPENELRILIADRAQHQVFEMDKAGQIHWTFGIAREAGNGTQHLNTPSQLQYTPERTYLVVDKDNQRVLEINAEQEIERRFDQETVQIKNPVCALRLIDGDTLILDAGREEIVKINPAGQRVQQYSYQPPPDYPLRMEQAPTRLLRLPTQELVLYNESRILILNPFAPEQIRIIALADLKLQGESAKRPPSQIQANPANTSPTQAAETIYLKTSKQSSRRGKIAVKQQSGEARLQSLLSRNKSEKESKAGDLNAKQSAEIFQNTALKPGSVQLYTIDRRRNGLVRINRSGSVIWHFGFDVGQNLSKPNFIHPSKRSSLITDTEHHRILEISRADREITLEWKGPKDQKLMSPKSAMPAAEGHILVADHRNQRLVELNREDEITWQFKQDGLITAPQYAEVLEDGDILYTDAMQNRVVQISRQGEVNWYYGKSLMRGPDNPLFGPSHATRLENGHTLISDTRNHRVIEVNLMGETVWEIKGKLDYTTQNKIRDSLLNPIKAKRLKNGNTLIIHHNYGRMVEVTPDKEVVWAYIMGRDVFLASASDSNKEEKIKTNYNRIDKRMIESAIQQGNLLLEVEISLMDGCQMKSVRASMIMLALENFGMVMKTFPQPEDIMADRFDKQFIIAFNAMVKADNIQDQIKAHVLNIAEVQSVELSPLKL